MGKSQLVKRQLRTPGKEHKEGLRLSSGSTMLNLACTGKPDGCFLTGHYYFMVGDSDSGKTFLALTCFAEAAKDARFRSYRLIYDAPEGGALMDVERFFGSATKERLEPPELVDGKPLHSETIQDFYFHVDDALADGRPFIYILDSQDSLSSKEEGAKFQEVKKASRRKSVEKVAGSYGDSKAKGHSSNLRRLMAPLERSGSILIIVNQTRDSFDLFQSSTYSGGRALKFYATLQLWSSPAGKLKRTVRGKERQLGIMCKIQVKKNRVTGRDRVVKIPIYHSYGMDDVGSMVDYLISEGVWKKSRSGDVEASGLGPVLTARSIEKLIRLIEENELESDLHDLVHETWQEIEEACAVRRKSRYVRDSDSSH